MRPLPLRSRALTARLCALVAALGAAMLAISAAPAMAATSLPSSKNVALIPGNAPVPAKGINGIMPISGTVSGEPTESFGKFKFSHLAPNQITSANLSHYDTVALIQVKVNNLTASATAALAQFVAGGGKLITHDGDETRLNDYSWILGGPYSTKVGAGCNACGSTSGTSTITENSSLISANPADPSYVNLAELGKLTDAIGDSNLLVSTDPRWFVAAKGTNANNESGAQVAYANHNGLVIYNGYDTDMIKSSTTEPWRCVTGSKPMYVCPPGTQPSVDWLAHMWYDELNESWTFQSGGGTHPSNLPHQNPVIALGTQLSPGQAGLPSNHRCVAKRTLFLRLRTLSSHRKLVEIDVYVNGKRVLRKRGNHFNNVSLKSLPRRGSYTVEIIATTNRGYHLIGKQRYHACKVVPARRSRNKHR